MNARVGLMLAAAALGGACIEFEPFDPTSGPREFGPSYLALLTVQRPISFDSVGSVTLEERQLSALLIVQPARDRDGNHLPHVTPLLNGDTLPIRPRLGPSTQVDWLLEEALAARTELEVHYPPDPTYTEWQPTHRIDIPILTAPDTIELGSASDLVLEVENPPAEPWLSVLTVRMTGDTAQSAVSFSPWSESTVVVPRALLPTHSGTLLVEVSVQAEHLIGERPFDPSSTARLSAIDYRVIRVLEP